MNKPKVGLLSLRSYGPEQVWNDQSWRPGEIEWVKSTTLAARLMSRPHLTRISPILRDVDCRGYGQADVQLSVTAFASTLRE